MSNSRYIKYSSSGLPKQRFTNSLSGGGVRGCNDDSGRYYRCWHCGSICDIERETLDYGDHTRAGVKVTSTTIDGATVYYPQITGGCWFCGCKNWKG